MPCSSPEAGLPGPVPLVASSLLPAGGFQGKKARDRGHTGGGQAAIPPSTAQIRRLTAETSVFLKIMRMPGWLFWLLLYAGAIFSWMVFFEHGPGWERFQAGAKAELTRAWEGLRRGTAGKW